MRTDFGHFEEETLGKPYDIHLLRRLIPFLKPYRMRLLVSILLVTLITILDLALPYVTKIAVDRYIVPEIGTELTADTPGDDGKTRYYRVSTARPEILRIVQRYGALFQIEETSARIAFQDLSRLTPEDLAVLRQGDVTGIGLVTVAFLLLILASFLLNFIQAVIMEYSGQRIMHDLRVSLFNHIQSLSVSFFTRNPVGRLVTRVTNDVQNMHELFTSIVSFVFKDLFLLIGIAAVLISIHWKLALVSFTVLPVVIYVSFAFADRARDVFRELRIHIAEINTRLSETISGIRVIQLFRHETENYRRFRNLNHENYLAGMRQIRIFGTFMPFIEFMGVVALAVVILYGGRGVLNEGISLGALIAFISYMRMFFRPIRDIAEKYNILQNAMASAERIFLILDNREKLPVFSAGRVDSPQPLDRVTEITVDQVVFEYVSGEPVLKGVTFSLRAGETLAIVGPTGSGKTTLIHLITRFYDPTSGRVLVNGRDLKALDPAAVRSRMALVMQEPFLFSGTIRDNIIQGNGSLSEPELERILKASNCKPFVDRQPKGVDSVLSEGGTGISSGERQLISIARAMARNPDLIILDEATSYVDSATEHAIQEALHNLMASRTAIVVAHRLSTARTADRILVLNRGRVIEEGTHQALMEKEGFYFRLNQL